MVPYDLEEYFRQLGGTYGDQLSIEHPDYGSMEFTYCYKADATVKGTWVIFAKTATALGLNPTALQPATSAVAVQAGCVWNTTTGAGGVWVQTKGRCPIAGVDGATDVADGDLLKLTNGVDVPSKEGGAYAATTIAIAEEAETVAWAAQATADRPTNTVYILGNLVTV
jgi:hypothetical protein